MKKKNLKWLNKIKEIILRDSPSTSNTSPNQEFKGYDFEKKI